MDERGDMRRRGKPATERASRDDAELYARLSRLRSEVAQCRRTPADRALVDGRLDEVERKLGEVEELAESATDRGSGVANNWQDKCFLIVHEVEAELCMLKPAALLYPTWTRLRENLYRFDEGQREAWKADIASRIQADIDEPSSDTLRQRLRQLTLELHESAARYNRLVEERAEVTREMIKLGVILVSVFAGLAAACVTLSTWPAPGAGATLVSLVAGAASGGMGAVFSRLRTLRDERTRREFEDILKWDMGLRACIGVQRCAVRGCCAAVGLAGRFPTPGRQDGASGTSRRRRIRCRFLRQAIQRDAFPGARNSCVPLAPGPWLGGAREAKRHGTCRDRPDRCWQVCLVPGACVPSGGSAS